MISRIPAISISRSECIYHTYRFRRTGWLYVIHAVVQSAEQRFYSTLSTTTHISRSTHFDLVSVHPSAFSSLIRKEDGISWLLASHHGGGPAEVQKHQIKTLCVIRYKLWLVYLLRNLYPTSGHSFLIQTLEGCHEDTSANIYQPSIHSSIFILYSASPY